ncbi:hypothetical protein [Lysobacter sp. CA199]|uniref:hypothetical protein n=1 Tax=Lysobacter sp. CA199 TaxID=3455608 RepID=UPI003F8D0BFD
MSNRGIQSALTAASTAIKRLTRQGITVKGVSYVAVPAGKGRKAVLTVDRRPKFSRFGLKSSRPSATCVEHVWAAPFYGVQLEYVEYLPITRAVGHG